MATERHHRARGSRLHLRFLPLVAVLGLLATVPAIAPGAAAAPTPGGADKTPALASSPRPKPATVTTGDGSNPPPHEAQRGAGPSGARPSFDPARSVAIAAQTTPTNKVFANPDGSK